MEAAAAVAVGGSGCGAEGTEATLPCQDRAFGAPATTREATTRPGEARRGRAIPSRLRG